MPELPEVETVCRTIRPLLIGRTFSAFELSWPRTLAGTDARNFQNCIIGRTVSGVYRRAKLVIVSLDDGGAFTVHLRMTGELLVVPPGTTPDSSRESYLRASFGMDDGALLDFYDIRKFGRITFHSRDSLEILDASYGVEPLTPEFTAERFHDLLMSRSRALKPFLLDQSLVAGLGNIYVDEALFDARLHPLAKSRDLSRAQSTTLRNSIVTILGNAVERHGTTLRDYRSGLGEEGGNQSFLRIYGKKSGQPCSRCDAPVERLVVGQRGTVFCPTCQPMPLHADRRHR